MSSTNGANQPRKPIADHGAENATSTTVLKLRQLSKGIHDIHPTDAEKIDGTTQKSSEGFIKVPNECRGKASLQTLPYELRRQIYGYLFPVGNVISLDNKSLLSVSKASRMPEPMPVLRARVKGILLASRAINEELTTMIYGENRFLLQPANVRRWIVVHNRVDGWVKPHFQDPLENNLRWLLFFTHLRPSTAMKIKRIGIYLAHYKGKLDHSSVDALAGVVANFPQMEILFREFEGPETKQGSGAQTMVERACRVIAEKRLGLTTLWHDNDDMAIMAILQRVMPSGYERNGKPPRLDHLSEWYPFLNEPPW